MSSPISGFTAIPNPQMLAFMPIQSYLMMYFAGSAWQFGKRKISAKGNEEFNKLTMKTLLEEHTMELKSVIPTLEKSLNDVTPLIAVLIEQYGDFIKEALKALPTALQNIIGGGGEFSNIPTTESQSGTGLGPAQTASFLHYFKTLADATKQQATPIIQKEINLNKPSTIVGLTIGQAREQAKQKQLAFEAQQRTQSRNIAVLTKTKQPTPQIANVQLIKPKAGQSAILARKQFINQIASARAKLKTNQSPSALQFTIQALRKAQQQLVNLLARYRF